MATIICFLFRNENDLLQCLTSFSYEGRRKNECKSNQEYILLESVWKTYQNVT